MAKWELCTIVHCYRGKGDALGRDSENNQIMKTAERIIKNLIKQQVDIDQVWFGFTPGCGTMNVIFILRQFEVKCLAKKEFALWICRSGEGF